MSLFLLCFIIHSTRQVPWRWRGYWESKRHLLFYFLIAIGWYNLFHLQPCLSSIFLSYFADSLVTQHHRQDWQWHDYFKIIEQPAKLCVFSVVSLVLIFADMSVPFSYSKWNRDTWNFPEALLFPSPKWADRFINRFSSVTPSGKTAFWQEVVNPKPHTKGNCAVNKTFSPVPGPPEI